jgi:hypothetical protein
LRHRHSHIGAAGHTARAVVLVAAWLALVLVGGPHPLGAELALAQTADGGLEARAERLAALRSEVAELSDTLDARREEIDARVRAYQAQQVDLEVQVQREELRLTQLQDLLEARRADEVDDADLEEALRPVVLGALAETRVRVAAGLPFRVDERLASLDEIRTAVEGGELAPTRALGRLWAFVEDDHRLARENALDRQTIVLGGVELLAEVARVGLVALYFRAPDGRVGFAVREGDGWTWQTVDGRADADRIEGLFETLGKGIRTGAFDLPWAFGAIR